MHLRDPRTASLPSLIPTTPHVVFYPPRILADLHYWNMAVLLGLSSSRHYSVTLWISSHSSFKSQSNHYTPGQVQYLKFYLVISGVLLTSNDQFIVCIATHSHFFSESLNSCPPPFRMVYLTCFFFILEILKIWMLLEWIRWDSDNELLFPFKGTASVILWPLSLESSLQELMYHFKIMRPATVWHPKWLYWMQGVTR